MRVEFTNGWSAELRELTFGQMKNIQNLDSDKLAEACIESLADPSGSVVPGLDDAPNAVVLSACAEAVKAAAVPFGKTGNGTATTPLSEETG